jgi:hypothetical protein
VVLEVSTPSSSHKTTILLSEALHPRLTEVARERGQSLGELARRVCEHHYGMTDQRERLAAVEALATLGLPVGPVEQMIAESVAAPKDPPD